MNPLTYETKRAHWGGTWDAIRFFKQCSRRWKEPLLDRMTPARFDILYATWMFHGHERSALEERGIPTRRRIPMSELRKLLGLAASTITKICQRLEVLEFVEIVRDNPGDRRCVAVVLRPDGITALRLAIECITFPRGGIRTKIESYVRERAADGLDLDGPEAVVRPRILGRLCTIIDRVRALARFLGPISAPIYDPRICGEVPYPD